MASVDALKHRAGARLLLHRRQQAGSTHRAARPKLRAAVVEHTVAADEGCATYSPLGGCRRAEVLRLCRRRQGPGTGQIGAPREAESGDSAAGQAATKAEAVGAPDEVKSSSAKSGSV